MSPPRDPPPTAAPSPSGSPPPSAAPPPAAVPHGRDAAPGGGGAASGGGGAASGGGGAASGGGGPAPGDGGDISSGRDAPSAGPATAGGVDRRRVVGLLVAVPLVVALILVVFAWPNARLEPRDLPLGIAAPPGVAQRLEQTLAARAGDGAFAVTRYANEAAARRAIEDRDAYGALVASEAGMTLLTASAASPAVAQLLSQAATGAAATAGAGGEGPASGGVRVEDVVPAPADDPRGGALNASILPLVLAGIVAAAGAWLVLGAGRTALHRSTPAGGVGASGSAGGAGVGGAGASGSAGGAGVSGAPVDGRVSAVAIGGGVVAIAVLVGLLATLVVQSWLGALDGPWLLNASVIALVVAAMGLTGAGLATLFGHGGLAVAALLFVLIGNPWSGVSSAPELLPSAVGTIGQLLPPGAGGSLLRSTAFFDGAGGAGPLVVLLVWAALGAAALAVSASVQERGRVT